MAEYIEREALIESLHNHYEVRNSNQNAIMDEVCMMVFNTASADVVPVVHGWWIPTYHTYYNRDGACQIADEWRCSECKVRMEEAWNYCPNCGAKMDGRID